MAPWLLNSVSRKSSSFGQVTAMHLVNLLVYLEVSYNEESIQLPRHIQETSPTCSSRRAREAYSICSKKEDDAFGFLCSDYAEVWYPDLKVSVFNAYLRSLEMEMFVVAGLVMFVAMFVVVLNRVFVLRFRSSAIMMPVSVRVSFSSKWIGPYYSFYTICAFSVSYANGIRMAFRCG